MKLVSLEVKNYRQFDDVVLNFDDGITILAGANNSGKTSLISLIKNIFQEARSPYSESDIPAGNIQEWIEKVYIFFQAFFSDESRTADMIDVELVNIILPSDEGEERILMKTTELNVHVSYDSDVDDIKLFADYIMDLDEGEHSFYFKYAYEVSRHKFLRNIKDSYEKIKRRFKELNEGIMELSEESSERGEKRNDELKERYLKQLLVKLYVQAITPVCYYCDKSYVNECKIDDLREFRNLFNFWFIEASRPLDDEQTDHSHMLSKQMVKMVKTDDDWNKLIGSLPDELLNSIQNKEIDKTVKEKSLESLNETITAIEQTNGSYSGKLALNMNITEDDISELLERITTATYDVEGYHLGESSQGLGYSNMIYMHLRLKEYEKAKDAMKVNMFFVEEPESHMHPQMQQVFIKYLLDYYNGRSQGLITTHSNEMVRVGGINHLRVIRRAGNFKSNLYDLSLLVKDLKKSEELADKELANFFDWFFEIGYSEIVFADKAIFYEGDTERLYIRKLLTLEKYKKLNQQYIAYIQVGGAYASNYQRLIELLRIKSLIITDIDYAKDAIITKDILKSKSTNATINKFYKDTCGSDNPVVKDLYEWKNNKNNILSDELIYICFQTKEDGYARTLEEAMLSKHYGIDVTKLYTQKEWKKKRKDSALAYSVPEQIDKVKVKEDTEISLRDILKSTSGNKTNFMYSVILKGNVENMEPEYIHGGLEWLMA